jgi:CRISPR-associated protein Csb1
MKYTDLLNAVQSAAGLRLRLRLQPFYGQGEIVFPPTYAGGGYLISPRRIPGYPDAVPCAILDSVQSQANRMEDALVADLRAGKLQLPHAETDFSGVEDLSKPVGRLSSLETPHRIFDAIIRDSELAGVRFPYTDAGKAVVQASVKNATALFQYDPTSLLFGSWDSTGVSGGLGEKFTRCVVSEVIAINALEARRGAARVDPLNAARNASVIRDEKNKLEWELASSDKQKGAVRPSEINHGNIPPTVSDFGGVSCDYIRQTSAISFPALRQLRFPVAGKEGTDAKAHAVLAAVALHAAALNVEKGWHLRSRCDLVLEEGEAVTWELLGSEPKSATLRSDDTRKLLEEAIAAAKAAGLPWETEPLRLKPSKSLADLVRKSQQLHRDSAETSD